MTPEPQTRAMAAIGLAVAFGAAATPGPFYAAFGIKEQPTGAARLGWRLFAARTATTSVLALSGNRTARDSFLPLQVLDQATWWWGWSRKELSLRTTLSASLASGAIIALDVHRRARSAQHPARTGA